MSIPDRPSPEVTPNLEVPKADILAMKAEAEARLPFTPDNLDPPLNVTFDEKLDEVQIRCRPIAGKVEQERAAVSIASRHDNPQLQAIITLLRLPEFATTRAIIAEAFGMTHEQENAFDARAKAAQRLSGFLGTTEPPRDLSYDGILLKALDALTKES